MVCEQHNKNNHNLDTQRARERLEKEKEKKAWIWHNLNKSLSPPLQSYNPQSTLQSDGGGGAEPQMTCSQTVRLKQSSHM